MRSFMIAGTHSGCGKSTVAMGLNRLLSRRGHKVQPWKCGPDYIDPGFHSIAAGRTCRNLDTRLIREDRIRELFAYHSADCSLVEGVMGYYDGDAGRFIEGSSYHLSSLLDIPVFLVLDVRSMAQSAGALAKGFTEYEKEAPIAGFILNRVGSDRHEAMVRDAVEEATGLPVVACLRKNQDIALPERHLGLVLADENSVDSSLSEKLDQIADLLEEGLDTEMFFSVIDTFQSKKNQSQPSIQGSGQTLYINHDRNEDGPVIAVARDEAFAFYYQENLDLLENRGARLEYFSPVKDKTLPEGCSAVYFGGGYPELYAEELSGNRTMLDSVRQAADRGMPVYGECGGYMYLAESLRTRDGVQWPMASILPGKVTMTGGLRALGYGDVRWQQDTFLADRGTVVPGHLFHWSCLEEEIDESRIFKMDKKGSILNEGFSRRNVFASYVHFHFASEPELARRFVSAAADFSAVEIGRQS